ncbi:hypothetical protein FKW77_000573 [Venturia effusa]|uniref:Uncharacterized protein n=1 Tax=Venturia effusa TaxID=50376 RepID=A0A517LES7_9PEZI|nr:hypothetical protein FKW77_000573 [Venturia effusa]
MNSTALSARSRYICYSCSTSMRHSARQKRIWVPIAHSAPTPTPRRSRVQHRTAATTTISLPSNGEHAPMKEKTFWENEWTIFSADNAQLVRKAQSFGDELLRSKGIPSEEQTMEAMKVIEFAASQLTRPAPRVSIPYPEEQEVDDNPLAPKSSNGGLLSLDSNKSAHPMSMSISTDLLSNLAYKILSHPPVFITPKILASYVKTQATLKRPQTIPVVFDLYANKPSPVPESDPIQYKAVNPNAMSQAIPEEVADAALEAAIESADLGLALAVIESSYAKRAFRLNKFFRKAAPGVVGLSLAPLTALSLASQLPAVTNIADPSHLIGLTCAGLITYVGSLSILGFVAITTRNDQMERVTWAPGMPLSERWLREEERAGLDKIAMAWGFKDNLRRGEEEGVEWEDLKHWCGVRGMILDAVQLMDGME